jgi:hypothetical protein
MRPLIGILLVIICGSIVASAQSKNETRDPDIVVGECTKQHFKLINNTLGTVETQKADVWSFQFSTEKDGIRLDYVDREDKPLSDMQ